MRGILSTTQDCFSSEEDGGVSRTHAEGNRIWRLGRSADCLYQALHVVQHPFVSRTFKFMISKTDQLFLAVRQL
jgi:hypothetical protein